MTDRPLDLVTGAYGNTGAAIVRRLTDGPDLAPRRIRTLTDHPAPRREATVAGPAIEARPHAFDDPDRLADAFSGVDTFYNTYWMRTGDRRGAYDTAVARCRALIDAAERAGVRRIVHLSVAHPALDSPYPYFRGKAQVEAVLRDSSVPTTIVRPALIFGGDSVLLHNLAWMLRSLPVFAVAGTGEYRVRPVHVDDVARLCVETPPSPAATVVDAVGPERPTYRELVTGLRDRLGVRTRIVGLPAPLVLAGAAVIGAVRRDDVLTRDELVSTMDGLADTDGPATGAVALSTWLDEHAAQLGLRYRNERAARRVGGRHGEAP